MLSGQILQGVRRSAGQVVCRRNLGVAAPLLQKASDPIQQLFVDKIREYRQKSGGEGKLVEPSPSLEREMKADLDKITKQFGGTDAAEMTKFPTFKFTDPVIDSITEPQQQK